MQVPTIRGAESLSISEIAAHLWRLQKLAEEGHLHQEDLEGITSSLHAFILTCVTLDWWKEILLHSLGLYKAAECSGNGWHCWALNPWHYVLTFHGWGFSLYLQQDSSGPSHNVQGGPSQSPT
jgi:hypothetical protein